MDWRLVSELDAFLYPKTKSVILASVENKSDKTKALSKLGRGNSSFPIEISLDSNEFRLSFDEDLSPLIQCDKFPDPQQWFKVKNFVHNDAPGRENSYLREIRSLIAWKGLNPTCSFEAAFSDEYPGEVRFTAEGKDDYDACFNEMIRRLNCSIHKKTKKYIPGHRYDLETGTYFYLGEFLGRKENLFSSTFYTDPVKLDKHYYLFVKDIKNCKTISDVFKTHTFGIEDDDIYIRDSIKAMVDSGEELQDDITDIQDIWPEMLDLAISKVKEGKTADCIFSILSYQSIGTSKYNDPKMISDKIVPFLEEYLDKTTLTYWDLGNIVKDNCKMVKGQSNSDALFDLFATYSCSGDGNGRVLEYYFEMFKTLGIDISKICANIADNYTGVDDMHLDFNLYLDRGPLYFKYHKSGGNRLIIQMSSDTSNNSCTLESLYGTNLTETLIQITKSAINNYGIGVKEFSIVNLGNKKSPKLQYTVTISIQDIIRYYNDDPEKVPDPIKEGIMSADFWSVKIITDKEDALK